jgi:hypothetical protein
MSVRVDCLSVKTIPVLAILVMLVFGMGQDVGAQGYDVEIHLNGGDDVAYIGEDNIVEIWIKNTDFVYALSLPFEFSIGRSYVLDPSHGAFGYVNPEGDAVGKFILIHTANAFVDNIPTDSIQILGAAIMSSDVLPIHTTHALCYTMKVYIPPGQAELPGGFCIDNIYWAPGAEWAFSLYGGLPEIPYFQGHPNSGSTNPDAPPVCFDIVERKAGCGDVNGDNAVNVGDAVYLINHVFKGGPAPLQDCCP